jgi:hypothetical protein
MFWVCLKPMAPYHEMTCIILSSVASPDLIYFFHILSQRHNFQVTQHTMCVLIFSTTFVWNIFHSKNWVRYDKKNIHWSLRKVPNNLLILMKLEFSWQIFNKYSSTKFHENPSTGSPFVPYRHKDLPKLSLFAILQTHLKTVKCCHTNTKIGSLCTIVKLQKNISYCSKYKHT